MIPMHDCNRGQKGRNSTNAAFYNSHQFITYELLEFSQAIITSQVKNFLPKMPVLTIMQNEVPLNISITSESH